ncbi:MAG: hypothetical protein ACQEWU_05245 [Bacillota bacterium]
MAETYSVEAYLKATGVSKFVSGFKNATTGVQAFKRSIKNIDTTAVSNAGKRIQDAGDKIKNIGNGLSAVGKTLTKAVTLPLVGLGTAAAVTGIRFDDAMAQVQAISGATGKDLSRLRDTAKQMGSTTHLVLMKLRKVFRSWH